MLLIYKSVKCGKFLVSDWVGWMASNRLF